MTDKDDQAEKMAIIQARQEAFTRSPFWFTVWDFGRIILNVAFRLGFWAMIAQCTCSGCIWGKP